MIALTLDEAKTIAIVVVLVLIVGAIVAAWVMKTVMQKLIVALVLGILAFAVYSQRTSLQDCADKVTGNFERVGTQVTVKDTECSFFGAKITISDPRDGDEDATSDVTG